MNRKEMEAIWTKICSYGRCDFDDEDFLPWLESLVSEDKIDYHSKHCTCYQCKPISEDEWCKCGSPYELTCTVCKGETDTEIISFDDNCKALIYQQGWEAGKAAMLLEIRHWLKEQE